MAMYEHVGLYDYIGQCMIMYDFLLLCMTMYDPGLTPFCTVFLKNDREPRHSQKGRQP